MARGQKLIDDLMREEGRSIHSQCISMGYLLMGVRGLGFLVLGWTTVVLLGGFVSALEKKDFWCLTLITLTQTTGLFDVFSSEKLSYIAKSTLRTFRDMLDEVCQDFPRMADDIGWLLCVAGGGIFVFSLLTTGIVFFAVWALYLCGLLISAGISFWRQGQLEHYRGSADGGANLKPALQNLYLLVEYQGLLYFFWLLGYFLMRWQEKKVAQACDFDNAKSSLRDYMRETRIGCEKDPTFAEGRSPITYAVGLMMDSKLPDSYLSGVRILDTLIRQQESPLIRQQESPKLDSDSRRHMLIKHVVGSASSSHILLKLLQMLDSRGPHDREMRERAARIIAYLAGEIRLDQFPRGIQCIASLLDTLEEYRLVQPYQRDWLLETCEQDWYQVALRLQSQLQNQETVEARPDEREDGGGKLREAYKELLLQGLHILRKLATDEDNCRVMSTTKGLLPKIMAPVTSDLLHRSIQQHGSWSRIVEGSLRVMGRLVTAPGETGGKLRREISNNKEAITTMERILKCYQCGAKAAELHKQAMGILTQLYMDEKYLSMCSKSRVNFIKMLLDIFTHDNKDSSIRNLAGEALAMLSSEGGSNATIILQGDAVGSLTKVLLHVENKKYRISAAQILEHLCSHNTKDDECLKKAMVDAMLKVLGEILRCGLTGEEIHRGKEANPVKSTAPEFDIENPHDDSRVDGRSNRSSSHQQNDKQDEEELEAALLSALLSLCVTVCDTFISADQDLALHLNTKNTFSFPRKLEEMVQRNSNPSHSTAKNSNPSHSTAKNSNPSHPTAKNSNPSHPTARNSNPTANCLRTMKLTTKMVISMMKHRGSYMQQDLESLMEVLSKASETMSDLDCSMIFASGDHGATTTLASLVKEAQELVGQKKAQELAIVCV